jgi:polysaccharide export outer membrane protein
MRVTRRLMLFFAVAIAAGGCAQQPLMRVQMAAAPAPYGIDNVVYGSGYGAAAAPGYGAFAAPGYGMAAAPAYATTAAPAYATTAAPGYGMAAAQGYGMAAAPAYATTAALGYGMAAAPAYATTAAPVYARTAAPAYATMPAPTYATAPAYRMAMAGGYPGGIMASPAAYSPTATDFAYTLDSGDRLRIVIFGQDGLTNSYVLDASGQIDMPLIGIVPARGLTSDQLAGRIADMLRQGFVREPHVAVEVEAYRPFFILGEVTQPGQYPYSPNMTVETAVAIAGGFGPRGERKSVVISRNYGGQVYRFSTPVTAPVRPGDTVQVQERWF